MSVVVERAVDCTSPIEPIWDALCDTNWMNRAVGGGPIEVEQIRDGAARFRVSQHGGRLLWNEEPFEFVRHQTFSVRRHLLKGPVRRVDVLFRFQPTDAGSRVTVRMEFEERVKLLKPGIRFGAGRALTQLTDLIARVDTALKDGKPRPDRVPEVDGAAIARVQKLLEPHVERPLLDELVRLVREAPDHLVARIRPYELADKLGLERRKLLAACLQGVRAGLFELRWELVCPSCRVGADAVPTLQALGDHGTCHLCDLEFGLDIDEAVEATFSPTPSVRKLSTGQFCLGGPGRTPHVMAQSILPPGGEVTVQAPSEAGRYRLFVRGGKIIPVELADGAAEELACDDAGTTARLELRPGGRLRVRATGDEPRHIKLERAEFPAKAATARDVTALPGFRRDFSAEVLRPDVSLRVSRVALFFSDLTGSTQLYSNVGDAAALKLVQDHFDVVVGAVERRGGTLVKTIGDAVMAAFTDDTSGLLASLDILREFEGFRQGHPHRGQVHIKLGLYGGPSYLVTANGILDYFGQTVNIAARLQAHAGAGELVIEAGLADHAIAQGALAPEAVIERSETQLRGVNRPIRIARLRST